MSVPEPARVTVPPEATLAFGPALATGGLLLAGGRTVIVHSAYACPPLPSLTTSLKAIAESAVTVGATKVAFTWSVLTRVTGAPAVLLQAKKIESPSGSVDFEPSSSTIAPDSTDIGAVITGLGGLLFGA